MLTMHLNNHVETLEEASEEIFCQSPPHFLSGSVIQLASGMLTLVDQLTTEDFLECVRISDNLKINKSVVLSMVPIAVRDCVQLSFLVGEARIQVTVESNQEHPFFVFNQGWSSFSPSRTLNRYNLMCHQLKVGDHCISLAKRDEPTNQSSL